MNRLQEKYQKEVLPKLKEEFGKDNALAVVRPLKVVVNVGIGKKTEADNSKTVANMSEALKIITGQKPKVCAAKKSIAGFKIRQGDVVGLCVTLRGNRMWEFLDKLMSIVLPRVKDFQGVKREKMDARGNYNLGITEQIVFPEISYDQISKVMGVQVTITTSGADPKESERLLELLGMPFEKKAN